MIIDDQRWRKLLADRAERPELVLAKAEARRRRPLLGRDGRLMLVAADHVARNIYRVGSDLLAMADRRRLLENVVVALRRPGVDGLLATPDVVEELLLLDELAEKVVIGSMNRGGLTGSVWSLDDRFTAYDAATIERMGLDGGKVLLRVDLSDPGTNLTLEACAHAVSDLASRKLMAMVEGLPAHRDEDGHVRVSEDPAELIHVVGVCAALGVTSAYTWLKLPANDDMERVMATTTLPTLLLGGDPGDREAELFAKWQRAMAIPQVRGLVAGRSLLYPKSGDVAAAVDLAVKVVHG